MGKVLGDCGAEVTQPHWVLPSVHTLQPLLAGELALLSPMDALNMARVHLDNVQSQIFQWVKASRINDLN